MITIEDGKKAFKDNTVFDDFNYTFDSGKITGLIGASGAGKTTLIKCMLGMEEFDHGFATFGDTRMPNRKALGNIGYMAQSDALYDTLTGYENVAFFLKFYDYDKKSHKRRIKETLEFVDLWEERNKKISEYSGGMKRRLSLALAFVHNPEYLVLDEPTVGIDPKLRKSIWDTMHVEKESGKTILVTTHVLDEAEKCDALILLHNGKVIAEGTPSEIKNTFNVDTIEGVFLQIGSDDNV